jgi:acylphosphatase
MKREKIKIFGRVQGVFFRHFTKKEAKKLDLKGWCRNELDDTVLIVVEGEETKLKNFIEWCRKGPPMANVEKVEVEEEKYIGDEGEFEIR